MAQASSLTIIPNVMALAMLVAVRRKRPLMQLVALMQNLGVIALTTSRMDPAKRRYPRTLRRLALATVRVPAMIGRLLHPRPPCRRRLHPALAAATMPLIRRLPLAVVKAAVPVLSTTTITLPHRSTPYAGAVGV
jgi:hypothetical protein